MPSKPPLPHPSLAQPPKEWLPPPADRQRTPALNWSAIVASASVAFALVVSVIAWIVTHPHKAPLSAAPTTVAIVTASPDGDSETLAAMSVAHPAPPVKKVFTVHRPDRQDTLSNHVLLSEEAPPPLPPPDQARAEQPAIAAAAPPPRAGETYGTQVLFLNNPAVAEETAKREKKLLFVMHISGNFEDSCFT